MSQKELNHLSANIKTYHRDTETLRHAKEAFEKAFDAKNTDIRRTLTTELDRIHEELYPLPHPASATSPITRTRK